MKPHITLTPSQFCAPIQETVLIHRHQCWAQAGNLGSTVYDEFRKEVFERVGSREIAFKFAIESPGLLLTFDLKNFYHDQGSLCRIFRVSRNEAERRKWCGAKPDEILLGEVGGWLAAQRYASPPKSVRLIYHVRPTKNLKTAAHPAWTLDLPLRPDDEMHQVIVLKMQAIAEALSVEDDNLPECSFQERDGNDYNEYRRCHHCGVRDSCRQLQRVNDHIEKYGFENPFAGIAAFAEKTKCWQREAMSRCRSSVRDSV
jgi:hypothetical protein